MSPREFIETLEQGEWTPLHYAFLDHAAPALRERLWREVVERASQVVVALSLPAAMAEAALPSPPPPDPVGLWGWVSAALRLKGIDAAQLSLQEFLAILASYERI